MTLYIEILQYLHYKMEASRTEIEAALSNLPSVATLKRQIAEAVKNGHIEVVGRGSATRYRLIPQAHITMKLALDTYFDKDIDERRIQETFNFDLINTYVGNISRSNAFIPQNNKY